MNILSGKRIVLGVSGSIAAYKSAELASALTKAGALVDTILTDAASKLISPLTFSALTGRRAYLDSDLWRQEDHVLHIELGEKNQAFLIAPATANTIAKLAGGLADNLLTLAALASRTTIAVAPAMDGGMYSHTATQANLKILQGRGVHIWGPAAGHLASGLSGKGRMLEPEILQGYLRQLLGQDG
ncbi:MAG: flavoprotein, partial [Anaerolineales bacterium]